MIDPAALRGEPAPWRTIWATIGAVVLTAAALFLLNEVRHLLVWLVVALFFTVAMAPAVDWLVGRFHWPRSLAVTVVVLVSLVVLLGLVVAFVRPLVVGGQQLADDLPKFLRDARAGRGWAGDLVRRFHLDQRLQDQSDSIKDNVGKLGSRSLSVLGALGGAIASIVTVFVLTFLMLLQAPKLASGSLELLPRRHRERVRRVGGRSAKAVTGYLIGNLLISVIAGVLTYVFLWIAGVPFKGVLALWVGFADLLPLVGATLGAAVVSIVAFVHSPAIGIATVIFFVVYQQIENHLLQPMIQSRTVHLNPLAVLVSVLAGVELAGMLGALLAIPACAIVGIVIRELRGDGEDDQTSTSIATAPGSPT